LSRAVGMDQVKERWVVLTDYGLGLDNTGLF
jgi:hypothetical protein